MCMCVYCFSPNGQNRRMGSWSSFFGQICHGWSMMVPGNSSPQTSATISLTTQRSKKGRCGWRNSAVGGVGHHHTSRNAERARNVFYMGAGGVEALCATKAPPASCEKHDLQSRRRMVRKFTSTRLPTKHGGRYFWGWRGDTRHASKVVLLWLIIFCKLLEFFFFFVL